MFNLDKDSLSVIGGVESPIFEYLRGILIRGFTELHKNLPTILVILELMLKGRQIFIH